MSVGKALVELATLFQASHIVRKHSVEEDETSERPTLIVKLHCIPLAEESSELTKILRNARTKVPRTYSIKFKIEFWT